MAISIPINQDGTINRIEVDGVEYYFELEVNPESLAKVNTATATCNAATEAAKAALPLGLCVANGRICQRIKKEV
jgi:hypothetical protein